MIDNPDRYASDNKCASLKLSIIHPTNGCPSPHKIMQRALQNETELAPREEEFKLATATNPITWTPQQIPKSTIRHAIVPNDAFPVTRKTAKRLAAATPPNIIGFLQERTVSEIHPMIGQEIAQLKFKIDTNCAASRVVK